MDRWIALFVALLVSLSLVGGVVADDGGGFALQTGDVETDGVVLRADVDDDGDATWTIDYRIRLDNENTTEAFESLQADIQNNSSDYRGQFADRMRSTVATAENATGREMAVTNVTVTAETTFSGQYGVVSYSFHWEGFAATEGDRIVVGDALAGLFLDGDTKLEFQWPEGYELQRVDPEPTTRDEQSVTWDGPVDFGGNQPRLVIGEAGLLPAWAPLALAGLVALLALLGGVWYYRERYQAGESPAGVPGSASSGQATGGTAAEPPQESGAAAEQSDGSGAADATTTASEEPAAGSESGSGSGEQTSPVSETPEELLSPEERVLGLLEENGGRMKQKTVTEELGWSAARTSQVVGDLRDAGKVESFRLGRENVLKFPDQGEELGGDR